MLVSSSSWADHNANFPWPWKLEESNPLNTLTINGLSVGVMQSYPSFNNGVYNVKGQAQLGNKESIFMGMKLWKGASIYFNPEMYVGYNPSNNIGVASSINVSVPTVESKSPYLQIQRVFLRQVIDLGGSKVYKEQAGGRSQALENLVNKLSEKQDEHSLTLTVGKFGVGDIFDDNIYSHDPSRHFMSSAFNGVNTIDWAGNSWGTTLGASAEWQKDWWTLRAGIFQGSQLPPSNNLEPIPLKQYMLVGEAEIRYDIVDQPGNLKLIGYQNHGYLNQLGEYNGVAELFDYLPYFAKERLQRRTKLGMAINLQQQLLDGVGLFMRAGWDNKTFDLNDVTHSINGGFVFNGKLWNRPLDEFGIAAGINSMKTGQSYRNKVFSQIGTSSTSFAPESHFETYYKFVPFDNFEFTLDYQFVQNPNFLKNSDTAHIFGIRTRINF